MTVAKAQARFNKPSKTTTPRTPEETLIFANQKRGSAYQVRYWGTEFEHPEAGNQAFRIIPLVHEAKHDQTIPQAQGSCGCDNCNHSCNCSQCSHRTNWCSLASHTEIATIPMNYPWDSALHAYIKALGDTGLNPSDYQSWCNSCESDYCDCDEDESYSEDYSNWGFHTHVDARDLTMRQVASVMRLATSIMSKHPEAFGVDNYSSPARETDIALLAVRSEWHSGRPTVNPTGIIYFKTRIHESDQILEGTPRAEQKGTIEFRQFRYTANPELHRARVAFARAVVDYVAEGKPLFYLLREKSLAKSLEALEINNH
jgi:hypothetical protein